LRRPPRDGASPDGETSFVDAVADAYKAGLDISFEGLFAGESRRKVALPTYPFQRERHWVEQGKQRRAVSGHPLLGVRHEGARGEISYETEVLPLDPVWLNDHRVFGRIVAPGALYGAMAVTASSTEGGGLVLEDMQLHNPLVFSEKASTGDSDEEGRAVQVVLDESEQTSSRSVQVFSKGSDGSWTMHVEGRVPTAAPTPEVGERIDLENLKARLSPADVLDYYRAKLDTGIDLGPLFRTVERAWVGDGEALGEVNLPELLGRNELDVHPLLLDGCFQVVGVARNMSGAVDEPTYLPFGWERMWLTKRLPDRLICHVRMSESTQSVEHPEVLTGELRIYDLNGELIGGFSGYTVKRATPEALLSAVEEVDDLLYQVVWRDRALEPGIVPADFFPTPSDVAAGSGLFSDYLTEAEVDPISRNALLTDMERWSRSYALLTLEKLGWQRQLGDLIDAEELRQDLGVLEEHKRLFRRLLEMLAASGVLEERVDGFLVLSGADDPLPEEFPAEPERFHVPMADLYSHGLTEIGLFRRSGAALTDVLRGQADPLTLLFSSGEPTAADLYLKAPVARAANEMLAEAVRKLVAQLPEGRRLRVIEVGAGTGSATASVLPELPAGRFDYTYTDISAGFFAEAEARFGDGDGCIEYRPLDIEKDPMAQGYDSHGYDLLIASNVLHATRYLEETLGHCLALMAPSAHLVALENLRGLGWMDLTFGQLDGWWRFADEYRPHHALAGPSVWKRALSDAGFADSEVLGVDDSFTHEMLDKGVIVAQGPERVTEPAGVWILAADRDGVAEQLAEKLSERNQTVAIARSEGHQNGRQMSANSAVTEIVIDAGSRDSWRSLIDDLPQDIPLSGVVHLLALDGHGKHGTTEEITRDVKHAGESALALAQALVESNSIPAKGMWFMTRGAQVLERESSGELAGSILWGLGKVLALEASHLRPKMIDLDPNSIGESTEIVNELLFPDEENHIAYRSRQRYAARLVRHEEGAARLDLPGGTDWVLAPDPDGDFYRPAIKQLPPRFLEPREVRVAVEATGLNFWDVFRSMGFIEEGDLGRELCGHVVDVGSEVSSMAVGDRVVGLGFGAFAPEMITHEALVAPAPDGISVSSLATIPSAYVSAALSYRYSGLAAGDRVLIHAGAGGVGIAAIQLAQAAGAEVFATASTPKRDFLRSMGVKHIFDSRTTDFGNEILEATRGVGIDVVLNSLTSEGFIDASLSCLARGGRFVELARRDILTEAEMAALRPDVEYAILELDVLKKTEPDLVGEVLREVMEQISNREVAPIVHSRWPLAEAGTALGFMRSARHIGKIVLTPQPLAKGGLRQDRTYLVTGGLGGIGLAVADWLADHGAGTIVLNGRREPDSEAEDAIRTLRSRGVNVEVELADVTDTSAIDAMLTRIDTNMPPLGGVIHSVGVLSDAALTNQTWASFEQVLWPKIIGAWHLHKATLDRDLDLFILFSSRVGVMGNPGQSNHAAANAFLDQLAGHRRALGLPGQSIAWGAWSEIGEAAEQRERIEGRRAALGGRWFTPQQGIRALEQLVKEDTTTSVVMSMDWSVFEEAVTEPPALVEELISSTSSDSKAADASSEDLMSQLRGAQASEREDVLVSFVQRELQAVLRLTSSPSPTVGFFDLGMDSLMAVELRNRLNRAFDGEYVASNTIVFDYPNVSEMARHLAEELGDIGEEKQVFSIAVVSTPEPSEPTVDSQRNEDGIAIVGMAGRFPGADNLSQFWEMLESGTDAVTDGRRDTGSWEGAVGDPNADDLAYRRGAFLSDIDLFDSRFFRISPIEARLMDPRQRMLLETSWEALEDAGMDPGSLRGSRTGVYAGVGGSEYRDLIEASGRADSYLGTTGSVTVGRVAFALGLEGPALPVDAACASSLASVHQAVVGLQHGEIDMALAGGVNLALSRPVSRFMMDVGMLSPTGVCCPFDADANGYVRGEACGMVVLKRLSDAEADGDRIWAIIRGSGVNQNGASAGLTVPNGQAQERVMREALVQAGITPSEVDYLEAHATGSQLGDPIELHAAASVYGEGRDQNQPLLVGSVKSNLGHTEWAAGVTALIKTVLSMNEGVIPQHLHFEDPNPHVEWDELPVRVAADKTEWPNGTSRAPIAGVNAFGMSGTNAHVLIEGYRDADGSNGLAKLPVGIPQNISVSTNGVPQGTVDEDQVDDKPRAVRLLPLSGRSAEALHDLAIRYVDLLEAQNESASDGWLSDLAWTAGVGRSHFEHRAGVVFDDAKSLLRGLNHVADHSVADNETPERAARRVASIYLGNGARRLDIAKELYETEPAVRSVFDRCELVYRELRGDSLLDVLAGQPQSSNVEDDPMVIVPAIYAFDCALTALWSSVGVNPRLVFGSGLGEMNAAQAAGMFDLEDGLRLSAALGMLSAARAGVESFEGASEALNTVLSQIAWSEPAIPVFSASTGRRIGGDDLMNVGHWSNQPDQMLASDAIQRELTSAQVDLVLQFAQEIDTGMHSDWPSVIGAVDGSIDNEDDRYLNGAFVNATAKAYESGLELTWEGLFAGENRRRVALPLYPFQRRRHWF
ncbi:MAG: SDR family NAD(P)-dependent oxidoreductase, partial [Chloroflexi bacterium]|nr:SDR family NAD(P)-dependent oxidoreductase [Chloroflexota bacterium]